MSNIQIVQIGSDGEPRASTEAIAAGYKMQHKNVLALLMKYLEKVETFGLVAFETRARLDGQHGGGDAEYALLNELQAGFLVSLMRNNAEVVEFKLNMWHEFKRMRESLANRDVTLLTRRILLEQKDGASLALARIGSGLMLDRRGELPGIRTERALLRAVMEPGLFPAELEEMIDKRNAKKVVAIGARRPRINKAA